MSQGVGPATDNPVEYISHHLQPLQAGSGFWTINIDTMFFSILIMFGVMSVAYKVGKNVTAGAPTGMQNVLETLIDFVNGLVKEAFPKPNKLVGPLGLTIFLWVFLMNAMDLVPVDLLPKLAHMIGIEYLKVVPTTDPHTTFAMSLTVFAICIYYNVKIKALSKFIGGGNKVKVSMRFKGREMEHQNLGFDLLKKLTEEVVEYAKVEVPPKSEGKQIMMILVPQVAK